MSISVYCYGFAHWRDHFNVYSFLLKYDINPFLCQHNNTLSALLGMAVSQIALGSYFSTLAQYLAAGQENQTACCEEEDTSNRTRHEDSLTLLTHLSWLPLPLLMIFTIAFNLGLGSLTWVVATEILPVKSRGWTHTIANITSNFCWFLVTKTFNDLQDNFGLSAPFFLYGSVCVFGLVFIYIFLPETRGKTYEETALEFEGLRPLKDRLCWSEDERPGKCDYVIENN